MSDVILKKEKTIALWSSSVVHTLGVGTTQPKESRRLHSSIAQPRTSLNYFPCSSIKNSPSIPSSHSSNTKRAMESRGCSSSSVREYLTYHFDFVFFRRARSGVWMDGMGGKRNLFGFELRSAIAKGTVAAPYCSLCKLYLTHSNTP